VSKAGFSVEKIDLRQIFEKILKKQPFNNICQVWNRVSTTHYAKTIAGNIDISPRFD